MSENDMSYMRG